MFTLFNSLSTTNYGVVHSTQWPYVRNRLQSNVKVVQDYEREYLRAVPADHYLVSIIMGITVPMDLELSRYYANVDAINLRYAQGRGFTSSISKGSYKRGVFYADSIELHLAVDDSFDYKEVHNDWMNAVPIKPLLHCKSDIGLVPPRGNYYSDETGLCVIEFNLTKLMVMYRAFLLAQTDNISGTSESVMQFIAGYVLPNMLPAQTDLAVFNKAYNKLFGIDTGEDVVHYKHPFVLPNVDTQFNYAIEQSLENISVSPKNFDLILKSVAGVFAEDLDEILLMPDIAATTQVDWCLIAARIKAVDFLVKAAGNMALATNKVELNHIVLAYRRNSSSQMLDQMLPPSVMSELNAQRNRVVDAAKMLDLDVL